VSGGAAVSAHFCAGERQRCRKGVREPRTDTEAFAAGRTVKRLRASLASEEAAPSEICLPTIDLHAEEKTFSSA